jgi:hypothetical protein
MRNGEFGTSLPNGTAYTDYGKAVLSKEAAGLKLK